eukprot:TRINITY_DN17409_c0_g2_i2.p1 TRINITY_DN17409_c0_g2~~TRINITY_DN17409_c0_g2_i2.p1  ORF type:complete len:277 (+),score=9.00 TRINITY_DN17409_c0_g2_i2:40-831(+)
MFEEPVTPESSLDEQPFQTPHSNDRKGPILVFPPESPITSPLASFSGQFDDLSNGKLPENYLISEGISRKKFITLVIQVEEVLIDIVDISQFGEMFYPWLNIDHQDSQSIQLSDELFVLGNRLIKLRPGVRESCARWKEFLSEVCFYSQLDDVKQILELFDFSQFRIMEGSMQEVEDLASECGDILWVSHTRPRWLCESDNIQFLRVMGYQYFSKVKHSTSLNDTGPGGGTGRRASFRCQCPYGRGGSSPLLGTNQTVEQYVR